MLTADILLSGPRGRRMLLAYAIDAERALRPEPGDGMFRISAHRAAYHLDVGQGTSRVLFGPGAEEARRTIVTAEDVARSLSEISLPDVTAVDLRSALAEAVDAARYWQEPDGEDVLVATEVMQDELRRVAEHVAGSEQAQWWSSPLAAPDQWSIMSRGDYSPDTREVPAAQQLLSEWRTSTLESEARAERDRPVDPAANWSGYWWSNPPTQGSTRALFDGTAAGLWFVEDSMGWERAVVRALRPPNGARIYEIDSAQAWSELCRRFPLEVTAETRQVWYRTTGRSGRWVIPDWVQVAESFEGVHLTVTGYLAAAGTAIEVDADTASVIAGWAPDETYWFTDAATYISEPCVWVLHDGPEVTDQPAWTLESQQ
ncbi:hypothetical protein [Rhodococcus sp. ARP2]|uniref:hypothetical protein n=1 Tax=Rhodococcus sp. ARP2 TaxID=1661385 RepID=UPI00069F6BF9|nr:hypothetical protein [Rhodococcus sp. ARP2]